MKKAIFLFLFPVLAAAAEKDIKYYISRAWLSNPEISGAKQGVVYYESLEQEARSYRFPKLKSFSYIAPIYFAEGDYNYFRSDLKRWGPYLHFGLELQQILFAFGRIRNAENAARLGKMAEEENIQQVKWKIALDTRKYFYGAVFAATLMKTIDFAGKTIDSAITSALEMMNDKKGDVTDVDLRKLEYFQAKINAYRSFAETALTQATAALEMTSGEKPGEFPERLLPETLEIRDREFYASLMYKNRPEIRRLSYGLEAHRELVSFEKKAALPVIFAGGRFNLNYTPMRTDIINHYLNDPYNNIDPGLALGFLWDFDPALTRAKKLRAQAELGKLTALKKQAAAGFPVELLKAVTDLQDKNTAIREAKKSMEAAQKWMIFAAAGFEIGSVEAKDVLEGLGAFVEAKYTYYQSVYDYNVLIGELCRVTGTDITLLTNEK
ncbi:MAG: hypothetical protein A2096_03455 [Spirochaetes bacterium GWF1_41_5]|nr:MAG: hypothetical protein A2096_03455 [Spirochaetes bacterium GWF1_41_5]HBE01568.1 hypothetical protein [Spirochaetia bacterium]